jgi:hypothetical protein
MLFIWDIFLLFPNNFGTHFSYSQVRHLHPAQLLLLDIITPADWKVTNLYPTHPLFLDIITSEDWNFTNMWSLPSYTAAAVCREGISEWMTYESNMDAPRGNLFHLMFQSPPNCTVIGREKSIFHNVFRVSKDCSTLQIPLVGSLTLKRPSLNWVIWSL